MRGRAWSGALNYAGVTSRYHDDTVKTCSTRRVPERSFNPRGFRVVMPGTPGAEESRSLPPSLCAPNSVSLMLKHISFFISLEKETMLTNQRVSHTTSLSQYQHSCSNSKRLYGSTMLTNSTNWILSLFTRVTAMCSLIQMALYHVAWQLKNMLVYHACVSTHLLQRFNQPTDEVSRFYTQTSFLITITANGLEGTFGDFIYLIFTSFFFL